MTNSVTGPNTYSDGTTPTAARGGRLGDFIYSELQGRYYENTSRGRTFYVASQAVATTTVGLATTYTGLCLSNPIGSGVNASILTATLMQSVIQSTQVEGFGLALGSNSSTNVTHSTPVTTQSALVGSNFKSYCNADASATLPTAPVYAFFFTNTATATQNAPGDQYDVAGQFVLTPGAYILFVTPTQASVAGMWFSFTWMENPI